MLQARWDSYEVCYPVRWAKSRCLDVDVDVAVDSSNILEAHPTGRRRLIPSARRRYVSQSSQQEEEQQQKQQEEEEEQEAAAAAKRRQHKLVLPHCVIFSLGFFTLRSLCKIFHIIYC